MWRTQLAVYLGRETENGFFGFIVPSESEGKGNFFLILDIKEGAAKEHGREILSLIKNNLASQTIDNLSSFENFINEEIKKQNLPTGLSLAAGFLSGNIFYLKTIGQGVVFVRRNNKLTKIIQGENTASGFVEKDDFFVLTTDRFISLFGEDHLSRIFDHKNPNQIVESLAPEIKIESDEGAVALFLQFSKEETEYAPEKKPKIQFIFPNLFQKFKQYQQEGGKKRTLTIGLVILIIIILFWSVGLGVVRRQEGLVNKKINKSKELITQKLDQAEEVAFLKLARAQSLVGEAKTELNSLKKEVGDKRKEIEEISNLIKEKENKIVKKEDKNFSEFFDLTVDKKEARGTKLYLNEDILAILDKDQGIIYLLSLTKKSLEKVSNSEIKSSTLIARYQENTFFYVPTKGVYRIDENNKVKVVINFDKVWGKIGDISIYNGNIYLLDKEKNKIYKYMVGEAEYGSKNDYLKSEESISLKDATSMMIDSSLYVGFPDYTAKFAAGARETFKTSFPDEDFSLNKVITSKDLEKVYSWDKQNGSLYILSKNGTYERQVQSSILVKGEDMVIYDNVCYILIKEKIYEVNLD
jgi:hypothetical protein